MHSLRLLFVAGFLSLLASTGYSGEPISTFNKDVAPILFGHCSSCHRPNEVGPFNLLTYADAKKRGRQLAEVTSKRTMPPWKPVKGHGEFRYDRSLSDAQIAVFKKWHDAGMPEGDPKDLPPLPKFPEGWHLGQPDLILKVEKPFRIPAEGDDLYVHFVLPTGLKNDQPFRAVQILPATGRWPTTLCPFLMSPTGPRRSWPPGRTAGITFSSAVPAFCPGASSPAMPPA
jgi:hypothetical protein